MASTTQASLNPYDVYVQAESFEVSAQLLNQHAHQEHRAELFIPSVVCRVFAVELYFKCILLLEQKPIPFKHELDTLFNIFSAQAQSAIEQLYDFILLEYTNEIARMQQFGAARGNAPFSTAFKDSLVNASKDFIRYRYFFGIEDSKPHSNLTILVILRAARQYILHLQPGWFTGQTPVASFTVLSRVPKPTDYLAGKKPEAPTGQRLGGFNVLSKCLNAGCPHVFDIGFAFEAGVIEEMIAQNAKLVPYPADGILECPVCHAKNDVAQARELVEKDHGRPIYLAPEPPATSV